MKHITASILLIAMLVSLAACSGDISTDNTADQDTTDAPETTSPYEPDSIPDNIDFGGKTVNIARRDDSGEYIEELNGELINDSIYKRDRNVEKRLNVVIKNIGEPSPQEFDYINKIQSSVMADDGSYDIVSGGYYLMPRLITAGVYTNLHNFDVLEFDKPWWAESLIEQTTIDGKVYLATGDIALSTIKSLSCIFANQLLWDVHGFEDPYTVVNEGRWTFEYLNNIVKDTFEDLNGNTEKEPTDKFGFVMRRQDDAFSFFYGFGLQATRIDESGYPQLALGEEKVHSSVDLLHNLVRSSIDALWHYDWITSDDYINIFKEARTIMMAGVFNDAISYRDMKDDFFYLPYPKYDEFQKDYNTYAMDHNLYGITSSCNDPEMAATVMEALASESFRLVTPAYYEQGMKVKYSRDDQTSQMLDLIRNSATFDLGMEFGQAMGIDIYIFRTNVAWAGVNSFSSEYAARSQSFELQVKEFVEAIEKLDN